MWSGTEVDMGADEARQTGTGRSLIERVAARVPGFRGYLARETRREVDQALRRELASRLDGAREHVSARIRRLPLAAGTELDRLAAIEKRLDAEANALRHAGSGYAGVFDAARIGEAELDALHAYDLALAAAVDAVAAAAKGLASGANGIDALDARLDEVAEKVAGRDGVVKSAVGSTAVQR
jgi:hypothetical protein